MIRLLDMYLARTLLGTTFISLMILVGLSGLIKFIEQLRHVGQGSYDLTAAGIYVLLSLPREIEQFFPMATLLGGLIGLGLLANNSELVVMQAAGLSRWNIITSAMKTALLLVVFVMAIGEWVAPKSETSAKEIRTQAISSGSLFSSEQLVWAKDGRNFVSIGEVVSKDELLNVNIYQFDEQLTMLGIISATRAKFVGQSWRLQGVNNTRFENAKISQQAFQQSRWQSTLTPDKLGVVTVKPEALSIRGLSDYVNYLENNSQDPSRYELALWRKILQPVSIGVMLLMAMSFIFGPLRSVTMGARVIMGVITGFAFFTANEVFGPLSLVYQMPPLLGALLPSVSFALFAVYLLRRQ